MNRFDSFLKTYIEQYLQNNLIDEIIITDETGQDAHKIKATFNDPRIKVYVNEHRLGPFLNKHKACQLAKNEWIVLIDSDNFADESYFKIAKEFIQKHNPDKESILAPTWARPRFDYRHLSGHTIQKSTFKNIIDIERQVKPSHNMDCIINTGNYILNKYLIDNINLSAEQDSIPLSSACDVVYMNTLLFEQFNMKMYMVPDLFYDHIVHNGSVYIQTHQQYAAFNQKVYDRFYKLYRV